MAKGSRRPLLTSSRSERLLGTYAAGYSNGHSAGAPPSELREEDVVWSTFHDETDESGYDRHQHPMWEVTSRRREAARGSRDGGGDVGGLSLAFGDSFRGQRRSMASSAPLSVPDWGKILRVESVESMQETSDGEEEGGDSEEMVPPHEYLAREYARSRKMEGASVVEGVGRTLKGRDMRRVRDAVWSQTGFYG